MTEQQKRDLEEYSKNNNRFERQYDNSQKVKGATHELHGLGVQSILMADDVVEYYGNAIIIEDFITLGVVFCIILLIIWIIVRRKK